MRLKAIISLMCFFILISSFSQITKFNKSYNPQDYSIMRNVYETDSGYVMLGGAPFSKLGVSKAGILIVFTDFEGNFVHSKAFFDYNIHYYHGLSQSLKKCSTGGYVLAGSKVGETYRSNLLMRFNDDFDTLWTKELLVDTLQNISYNVIETNDRGFLMVGTCMRSASGQSLSLADGQIIKTDSLGNLQWWKNIGNEKSDFFKQAITTDDNGYLLAGFTRFPPTDPNVNTALNGEWYLVKIDSLGNVEDELHFGNPYFEDSEINGLISLNAGGYLISGSIDYCADTTLHWCEWRKGRIIKLDPDLNVEWDKLYLDTSTYAGMNFIKELDNNELICLGQDEYRDWETWGEGGVYDYLPPHTILTKLTSSGDIIWKRRFFINNSTDDTDTGGYDLKTTSDNGFVITGYGTDDNADVRQKIFLIKTDSLGCDGTYDCDSLLTGTGTWVDLQKGELKVYPNPVVANKNITIEYFTNKPQENYKLELYNMQGMLLQSKNIKAFNQTQIETNMLSPGLYIVRLMDNGICIAEKKVVITR